MTTLLLGGRRRCDAVCHNAKKSKCTCICGGQNHGTKNGNGKGGEEVGDKTLIVNGYIIPLARSIEVVNHSPTGFSWGYGGSGPAQTALAVLLECTTREEALAYYQTYKWEIIAGIPQEQKILAINSRDVQNWLEGKREEARKSNQKKQKKPPCDIF